MIPFLQFASYNHYQNMLFEMVLLKKIAHNIPHTITINEIINARVLAPCIIPSAPPK